MKIKVAVMRTMEIDVDSSALADLNSYWIDGDPTINSVSELDKKVLESIKDVEYATGIPFGDSSAPETIFNVCDMDGNTILQW